MSNEVDIDPQALGAELATIEIPAEPGAPEVPQDGVPLAPGEAEPAGELTLEQIQAKAAHWKGGADFLVNFLCDTIAPAWGVSQQRREKLAQDGSLALAAWFPDDAIPLKWLLLLNVGTGFWQIVTEQRERNGGKLPPLRLPPPGAAKTGEGASSPAGAGGAVATSA